VATQGPDPKAQKPHRTENLALSRAVPLRRLKGVGGGIEIRSRYLVIVSADASVWVSYIGIDRALGYRLKSKDSFGVKSPT
jgi:hypothetical protein